MPNDNPNDLDLLERYPIILPSSMLNDDITELSYHQHRSKPLPKASSFHSPQSREMSLESLLLPDPPAHDTEPSLDMDMAWVQFMSIVSDSATTIHKPSPSDQTLSSNVADKLPLPRSVLAQSRNSSRSSSTSSLSSFPNANVSNAPHKMDVICSRGRGHFKHPGNIRFRQLVKTFVPEYMEATSKLERSIVIDELIDVVQDHQTSTGGSSVRFVKYQRSSKTWEKLELLQARDKVGHALRDAVQEARELMEMNL